MPVQDYTLNYRVDTTQAAPAFAQILQELNAIAAGLNQVNQAAHGASTGMSNFAGGAQANLNGLGGAAGVADGHMKSLGSSTVATFAKFMAMEKAVELVSAIGEQINSAREHMKELAEEAGATRDALRELAAMKGKNGPTDDVVGKVVMFGGDAGMNPKEARQFLESFGDVAPAALQKENIGGGKKPGESDEDYEKRVEPITDEIALLGAKFGKRMGMSPATAGMMTGTIGQTAKLGSAQDAATKFAEIKYGLGQGKGRIEPLMDVFANLTASMVEEDGSGAVGDTGDLSIIYGLSTLHHKPKEAASYVKKAARELRQFNGQQSEGLREMGITPDDNYLSALRKVKTKIDAAKAEGRRGDQTLRDLGFSDEAGIQALIEQTNDLPLFDKRKENRKVDGQEVIDQNAEFQKFDLSGRKAKEAAEAKQIDWLKGRQGESLQIARLAAMNRMRDDGSLGEDGAKWFDMIKDAGGILPWMGVPTAFQKRVDQNAATHLEKAIRGTDMEGDLDTELHNYHYGHAGMYTGSTDPEHLTSGNDLQWFFSVYGEELLKRKIDPYGDTKTGTKGKIQKRMDAAAPKPTPGKGTEADALKDMAGFEDWPAAGKGKGAAKAWQDFNNFDDWGKKKPGNAQASNAAGGDSLASVADILRQILDATREQTGEIQGLATGGDDAGGFTPSLAPVEPGRA